MKQIIVIRGPLGVGKTTVAKALALEIGAKYYSIDDILAENKLDIVEGESIPVENFLKANDLMLAELELEPNQEKSLVIDGNFYFQEAIDDLSKKFDQKLHILTLIAPVEICINRDSKRRKPHGEDATRAVYSAVMQFAAGTEVDAENKTVDEVVTEIVDLVKG